MKRWLILPVILCLLVSGCRTTPAPPISDPLPVSIPDTAIEAKVVRVVDGDTIIVYLRGQEYRVRYIGIDAPETVHPNVPDEPYGKEASEMNKRLVERKRVTLEQDVSEMDQYGRLLRYVYIDGIFVNAEMVRLGYAQVTTYPPDTKYQELFLELQREA